MYELDMGQATHRYHIQVIKQVIEKSAGCSNFIYRKNKEHSPCRLRRSTGNIEIPGNKGVLHKTFGWHAHGMHGKDKPIIIKAASSLSREFKTTRYHIARTFCTSLRSIQKTRLTDGLSYLRCADAIILFSESKEHVEKSRGNKERN